MLKELFAYILASLGIGAGAGVGGKKVYDKVKIMTPSDNVDLTDRVIALEERDKIQNEKLDHLESNVEKILYEMEPNHGKSFRDEMDHGFEQLNTRIGDLKDSMDHMFHAQEKRMDDFKNSLDR